MSVRPLPRSEGLDIPFDPGVEMGSPIDRFLGEKQRGLEAASGEAVGRMLFGLGMSQLRAAARDLPTDASFLHRAKEIFVEIESSQVPLKAAVALASRVAVAPSVNTFFRLPVSSLRESEAMPKASTPHLLGKMMEGMGSAFLGSLCAAEELRKPRETGLHAEKHKPVQALVAGGVILHAPGDAIGYGLDHAMQAWPTAAKAAAVGMRALGWLAEKVGLSAVARHYCDGRDFIAEKLKSGYGIPQERTRRAVDGYFGFGVGVVFFRALQRVLSVSRPLPITWASSDFWRAAETPILLKKSYRLEFDQGCRVLHCYVDGFANPSKDLVLQRLVGDIARFSGTVRADRVYVSTRFQNPTLEMVLRKRYGMRLVETKAARCPELDFRVPGIEPKIIEFSTYEFPLQHVRNITAACGGMVLAEAATASVSAGDGSPHLLEKVMEEASSAFLYTKEEPKRFVEDVKPSVPREVMRSQAYAALKEIHELMSELNARREISLSRDGEEGKAWQSATTALGRIGADCGGDVARAVDFAQRAFSVYQVGSALMTAAQAGAATIPGVGAFVLAAFSMVSFFCADEGENEFQALFNEGIQMLHNQLQRVQSQVQRLKEDVITGFATTLRDLATLQREVQRLQKCVEEKIEDSIAFVGHRAERIGKCWHEESMIIYRESMALSLAELDQCVDEIAQHHRREGATPVPLKVLKKQAAILEDAILSPDRFFTLSRSAAGEIEHKSGHNPKILLGLLRAYEVVRMRLGEQTSYDPVGEVLSQITTIAAAPEAKAICDRIRTHHSSCHRSDSSSASVREQTRDMMQLLHAIATAI